MNMIADSDDHPDPPGSADLPPPVGETLHDNVDRLVSDVKGVLAAEKAYWKARVRYSRSLAKQTVLLFGAAIALAASAFTALILGMLLILAARIGPMWATINVVTVTLVVAAALAWLALRRAKKLTFSTPDPTDPMPESL